MPLFETTKQSHECARGIATLPLVVHRAHDPCGGRAADPVARNDGRVFIYQKITLTRCILFIFSVVVCLTMLISLNLQARVKNRTIYDLTPFEACRQQKVKPEKMGMCVRGKIESRRYRQEAPAVAVTEQAISADQPPVQTESATPQQAPSPPADSPPPVQTQQQAETSPPQTAQTAAQPQTTPAPSAAPDQPLQSSPSTTTVAPRSDSPTTDTSGSSLTEEAQIAGREAPPQEPTTQTIPPPSRETRTRQVIITESGDHIYLSQQNKNKYYRDRNERYGPSRKQ